MKVFCAHDLKEIDRRPGQIARNKTGRFFCNNDCRFAYEKEHGNCNRDKHIQRGYRHPARGS